MKQTFVKWLKAAGVRSLKTVAQTMAAGLTTALGSYAVLGNIDWIAILATAAVAGVYSLLTSVAGLPELQTGEENAEE